MAYNNKFVTPELLRIFGNSNIETVRGRFMICDLQQQFFRLINDNRLIIKACNATNLSTFPKKSLWQENKSEKSAQSLKK